MSGCQEMVPGASVLLGVQRKFTRGQVKSRGGDVVGGYSGDCCRGPAALTACLVQL